MARKNLLTAEMIGLSSALLDPARHRSALTDAPMLAPMVSELEEAHRALLAQSPASDDGASQELAKLQQQARETDLRHDAKGGGVLTVLEGIHRLADDEAAAAQIAAVRDALFPKGGSVFLMNYVAEAGHAELAEAALAQKPAKDLLRSVIVRPGVTLYDEARAYVKAGRRLGVLESRRTALAAAAPAVPAEEAVPVTRSSAAAARNEWLQVIDLLVRAAKRLKGAQAVAWAAAANDIASIEAKADERAARTRAATVVTDDEPDEPAKG